MRARERGRPGGAARFEKQNVLTTVKQTEARHRFFAASVTADEVELPAGEAHHALHVLRLGDGDVVEVFDGSGEVVVGPLRPEGRRAARVEVSQRRSAEPPPAPAVELAFAVPKGKRLDWLLEKAAELGAAALAPVVFERSVARPGFSSRARVRWRAACIAAAKQCGAAFLPEIAAPRPLDEYLRCVDAPVRLQGDAGAREGLPAALEDLKRAENVAVLVGPEGGLTDPERAAVAAAGFRPVRLGSYTLRVETAAVALLAAVRAWAERDPLHIASAR